MPVTTRSQTRGEPKRRKRRGRSPALTRSKTLRKRQVETKEREEIQEFEQHLERLRKSFERIERRKSAEQKRELRLRAKALRDTPLTDTQLRTIFKRVFSQSPISPKIRRTSMEALELLTRMPSVPVKRRRRTKRISGKIPKRLSSLEKLKKNPKGILKRRSSSSNGNRRVSFKSNGSGRSSSGSSRGSSGGSGDERVMIRLKN